MEKDIKNLNDKFDLMFEVLKDFKTDVNRRFNEIDKRFEQVDKRFEQVDKRFEQMDKRFELLYDLHRDEKKEREKMEDKLDKVYETRYKVEYKIWNSFIIRNLFWNWWILSFFMIFWYFIIT